MTSRRFCDVCAVGNQGYEWMPRIIVVVGILIGLFGIGSYLRSGGSVPPVTLKRSNPLNTTAVSEAALKPAQEHPAAELNGIAPAEVPSEDQRNTAARDLPGPTKEQTRVSGTASDDPVYYCGAMTKKGKPCSRRVKTKGRCWQHIGQPSALASRGATDIY